MRRGCAVTIFRLGQETFVCVRAMFVNWTSYVREGLDRCVSRKAVLCFASAVLRSICSVFAIRLASLCCP